MADYEPQMSQIVAGNGKENTDMKPDDDSPPQMSKSALKRLRRKEKFDQFKPEKRRQQKERRKQRLAEARERGETLGPTRKALRCNTMKDSARQERIVVDCGFDDLMTDRDVLKLVNQIQRCYSINRRSADPLQLYITSLNGKTLDRLNAIGDYKGWDLHIHEDSYTDVFPKEQIVYLSSESDNVLTDVDSANVYIIGGLVDHNHHKGLCHRLAVEKEIHHARLPIDEYIRMQTRKVLTVDQVFNILVQFVEVGKWEEAFYRVIPKRKGAVLVEGEEAEVKDGVEQGVVAEAVDCGDGCQSTGDKE